MIKFIATDLDGTLLNSRKEAPADFVPWVQAHPDLFIALASGRQYYTLLKEFPPIAGRLIYIAENGGLVIYKEETLHIDSLKPDSVEKIITYSSSIPNTTPILCGEKSAYSRPVSKEIEYQEHLYYTRLSFTEDLYEAARQDRIIKIALYIEGRQAARTASQYFSDLTGIDPDITSIVSGAEWIDINNKSTNKGAAVRAIQKKMGLRPEECMSFGDYMNDYELLANCGESYAMANAIAEIKAIAKHTAPSNEEAGVMQVLRERFD